MSKFLVITSIFNPTEAVRKFSQRKDWTVIVVGDRKTPSRWKLENVIYLSPDDQKREYPRLAAGIPWNNYGRKTIGYLYALQNGAKTIAESDDDNLPYDNWGKDISFSGHFDTVTQAGFVNIYSFFTDVKIWPRGYPLNRILDGQPELHTQKRQTIGIWQFLADEDPDVDAIYRLTINEPVYFAKRNPVVLDPGAICPFNSQNTFTRKELFATLYMPAYVSIRFTDILRGLIAQPIMWQYGYTLGFAGATVRQKRNPHDYLKDFEQEIPMYRYAQETVDIVSESMESGVSVSQNMLNAYRALIKHAIVPESELVPLNLWLDALG